MLVRILRSDGRMEEQSWNFVQMSKLREIVGGNIELVRVLGEGDVYITMVVNENGAGLGLPKNAMARSVYLRNVQRAFPNHDDPSKAAKTLMLANVRVASKNNVKFVELGEEEGGPFIYGDVVLLPIAKEKLVLSK